MGPPLVESQESKESNRREAKKSFKILTKTNIEEEQEVCNDQEDPTVSVEYGQQASKKSLYMYP